MRDMVFKLAWNWGWSLYEPSLFNKKELLLTDKSVSLLSVEEEALAATLPGQWINPAEGVINENGERKSQKIQGILTPSPAERGHSFLYLFF